MDDLRKSLEDDDAYIQKLIDLVPPQYYFEDAVKQKITEKKHDIINKKLKGSKREQKLSKKGKHTLARLDPYQQKTVSQIQLELEEEEKRTQKKTKTLPTAVNRVTNLHKLKEKLKTKTTVLGKRKNRENQSEEKRKRKKRICEKRKYRKLSKVKINNNYKEQSRTSSNNSKPDSPGNHVYNKENKILYSKFNIEESEKQVAKSQYVGKKPEKLLKKSLKEKQKEQAMEASAPEQAYALKEKVAWKKAIDRAVGLKVKDNPELLKKSIKKRKQKKQQSQKKWEERKNFTKKLQQQRQQKRNKNIQTKKQEKINKKIKKAKKKGRIF